MNTIKFYRRKRDGTVEVKRVRVTQRKRDTDREVRCKPSLVHPYGTRSIPNRYPTPAQAKAAWLDAGWSLDRRVVR